MDPAAVLVVTSWSVLVQRPARRWQAAGVAAAASAPALRSTPPSPRPGGGTSASGPQEAEAEVNQVECMVCRVTAGKCCCQREMYEWRLTPLSGYQSFPTLLLFHCLLLPLFAQHFANHQPL